MTNRIHTVGITAALSSSRPAVLLALPAVLLIALLTLAAPAAAQPPPPDAAQQADVVFVGRVVELAAVADADVPASATTAVVELVDLMRPDPPGVLADFVGRKVTVDLRDGGLAAGDLAIFFTRLWQLGDGLAVVELERRPVSATAAAGDRARADLAAADDRRLAQRLEAAELVVVGKVVGMRTTAAVGPTDGRVTEHDPEWMEAVVEVQRRLKGPATAAADDQVVVRFPGSQDVAWRYAPRLEIGQEGLFLLDDSGLISATAGPSSERWKVDESGQVLDADQADRAARLLRGQ